MMNSTKAEAERKALQIPNGWLEDSHDVPPDIASAYVAQVTTSAYALTAEHPGVVTATTDELAANWGASRETITAAWALILAAELAPAVQGPLEVDPAARVTVFPMAVVDHGGPVPATVAGDVAGEWLISC